MDRRSFLKAVMVLPVAKHLLPDVELLGQSLDIQPKLVEGQGEVVVVSTPTYADKVMEYEPFLYKSYGRPLSIDIFIDDHNIPWLDCKCTVGNVEPISYLGETLIAISPDFNLILKTNDRVIAWNPCNLGPLNISLRRDGVEWLKGTGYINHFYWPDENITEVYINGLVDEE